MTETNSGDPLSWKKQVSVPHVAICIHLVPMKSKAFDGGKTAGQRLGLVEYQHLDVERLCIYFILMPLISHPSM